MSDNLSIFGKTYTGVTAITLTDTNNQQQKFINTADANAVASNILNGKTAYINGEKITGNMPIQAAQTITPGTTNQTIAAGKYLTGAQTIQGDSNLTAGNIANGVTIFGITGTNNGNITLSTDADNRVILPTSMANINVLTLQTKSATPGATAQSITCDNGYDGLSTVNVAGDANLVADNIAEGVSIFGVTGTHSGGSGVVGHTVKVRNSASGYDFACCVIYADSSFEQLWLNAETTINNVAYIIGGVYDAGGGDTISAISDCTVLHVSGSNSIEIIVSPNNDNAIVTYSCACLSGDTVILMANKEYKRIDEINAGEKVLSFNPETKQFEEDEVTYSDATENKMHTEYDIWYFENDYEITTIHRHRFYNVEHERMMYMDEWKLGEHTITNSGIQIALIGHKHIQEPIKHYTIFTNRQNYFANGMLSGNRHTQPISLNDLSNKEIYTDINVPVEIEHSDSEILDILLGR